MNDYGLSKGGNNPRFDGFSNAKGKIPALTDPGLTKTLFFWSRLRKTSVARRISTFLKFGNLGCKSGPKLEFSGLGNLEFIEKENRVKSLMSQKRMEKSHFRGRQIIVFC